MGKREKAVKIGGGKVVTVDERKSHKMNLWLEIWGLQFSGGKEKELQTVVYWKGVKESKKEVGVIKGRCGDEVEF